MKQDAIKLWQVVRWDLIMLYKHGIVWIALAIAAFYSILLLASETAGAEKLIVLLVFSDPVMYGFLFVSVIILFEKDAGVHQVLAITPMPAYRYLWSKAIAFSLLALAFSCTIIVAAQPAALHVPLFIFAVIASAVLFVFVGVIGVSFVENFNQFFLLMPIVLGPVCLPFLDYFQLAESWFFYLMPTQACLILFQASVSDVETWKLLYGIIYIVLWILIAWRYAVKFYVNRILHKS